MKTTSIKDIKTQLDLFDQAYTIGKPLVSDKTYDTISDFYYQQTGEDKSLQIGAPATHSRVSLPRYMGSMTKSKVELNDDGTPKPLSSLTNFISKYNNDKVISEKLDGASLLLGKNNKGDYEAYTRGNGIIGQNVNHLIPYLKCNNSQLRIIDCLGKLENNTYVRGELIIPHDKWEDYQGKTSGAVRRNIVSGFLNKKSSSFTSDDFDTIYQTFEFLAYEILVSSDNYMTPGDMFETLIKIGFDTPVFEIVPNSFCNENNLMSKLSEMKQKSRFEIDGIILADNTIYKYTETKNPKHARAFKMDEEGKITEVIGIDWRITKKGILGPTVIIKTVKLNDVNISRAYGYNAKHIYDNQIGIGSIVSVVRGGDVIPKIDKVIKPNFDISRDFPDKKWYWENGNEKNSVHIIADDHQTDPEVVIRQIEHFVKKLEIEFIGPGNIKNLFNSGFNSISKYINIKSETELQVASNIKTSANKIFNSITSKLSEVSLEQFSAAIPCFKSMGTTKIKLITDVLPNYYLQDPETLRNIIPTIKGLSTTTAEDIVSGLECVKMYIQMYHDAGYTFCEKPKIIDKDPSKLKLVGKVFCFTGFRDKNMETKILSLGGTIENSMKKSVNTLVIKDKSAKKSSKVVKAENDSNIEVIDKEQLSILLEN